MNIGISNPHFFGHVFYDIRDYLKAQQSFNQQTSTCRMTSRSVILLW